VIRARLGALLGIAAVTFATVISLQPVRAQINEDRRVMIVFVVDSSFEELLAIPDVASLARAGGAALLARWEPLVDILHAGAGRGVVRTIVDPHGAEEIHVANLVERAVLGNLFASRDQPDEVLVMVIGADFGDPSSAADGGIVLAAGRLGEPGDVFSETGEQGSLTSDSTRRNGVVLGDDVRPTVAAYLGTNADRGSTVGEPIRIIEGPPPYALHDRYLAQRQLYVPIGTAAAVYVIGAGLLAIGLLARGERAPVAWRRVMGWASLSVPMLATGLLAAGHLPELSYATAVPMVAIVTVFGTMAFSPLERAETTLVPFGIGIAVLVAFVLEAASGWAGMLTPLLGGSQLDGGRFYGMPNVALGLLVGSCLWVAHRLRTVVGFALLCGAGLFAGLPFLGADLGGAVTSFAAAGLWVAVRERDRLAIAKGAAVTVAVTAIGTAVILVSHAFSPFETHVTRFESDTNGLGGIIGTLVERLEVGFDLIARNPAALIPVVGLPLALFVALRPPPLIRATFQRWPAWRDAVVVTFVAGIVAYLVNDTGPAAAGLFFGLGLGGMVGVSLLAPTGKMRAE
jgi:hypothetical protein